MNRYFEDTRYYLKRAGTTAKKGVAAELEPVRARIEALRDDEEPEPSRVEEIRADLAEIQERAEGKTRKAIAQARERLPVRGAAGQ